MDYLLGAAIGGLTAFAFSLPAITLELIDRGKLKDAPLLVDVKTMWGRALEKHEVFLVALLIHLVIGSLYGLIYVLFVKQGWLVFTNDPYSILSLVIYSLGAWIVTGTLVFPALGLGLFGRKEGRRVWLEMLASHYLLGFGLWLVVRYYQPFFFMD